MNTQRGCLTGLTAIDAGPDFARRLSYSLKDYARGAVEYKGGKPFMTATCDEVSAAMVLRSCRTAERIYRLWVRPYDGGGVVTRAFVRAYMAAVKCRIGTPLRWYAAIHVKSTVAFDEHRHFHVIMCGAGLKIGRRLKYHGLADIGAELLTDRLGLISEPEMQRAAAVTEANAERRATFALLRRNGFKGWQIQHFMGVAR